MTEVGEVIAGRYRVGVLVGRGGMAAVWVGHDLLLDRPVAIKKLSGGGLDEPMAVERFELEARSVAQLAHPNVIAVHDYGTAGGEPYLIMELVAGETVAAMLRDGPLTIAQAVAIATQTCDGLAAAHEAGVVHRDIKPSNLIVTPAGVVKICDFGIARMLGAGLASMTGETEALGTVSYMAPERVGDHPVDHRVDLYGLGCTLYAMLAGAPPFAADSVATTLALHATQQPVPVSELRADVPATLDALIIDLLAKEPTARPTDATQVKARLLAAMPDGATVADDARMAAVPQAAALAGIGPRITPDDARTASNDATQGRPLRRHPIAVAVIGLLVVAGWLFGLAGWWPEDRPPPAEAAVPLVDTRPAAPPSTPTSEPASVSPSAGPTPTAGPSQDASPTPSTPTASGSLAPPVEPVAAMRVSIQRQVDTGNLAAAAAPDLFKKVDEIAREMNAGHAAEVAKKIGELRHKLEDLLNGGKLTATGYNELAAGVDAIEASTT
jgi:eukaryotic-like serine/threonine-protein kinase